jgi:hypothetical protein
MQFLTTGYFELLSEESEGPSLNYKMEVFKIIRPRIPRD